MFALSVGIIFALLHCSDKGSFHPFPPLYAEDPLSFPGYLEKISQAQEKTALDDAILIGTAAVKWRANA